jgi:hypothetical protein
MSPHKVGEVLHKVSKNVRNISAQQADLYEDLSIFCVHGSIQILPHTLEVVVGLEVQLKVRGLNRVWGEREGGRSYAAIGVVAGVKG